MTAHSVNGYNRGCRCEVCKQAAIDHQRTVTRARFAERVDIDGQLVAVTVPEDRHGRYSTYRKWGCRCDACRAVARSMQKATRSKRGRAA